MARAMHNAHYADVVVLDREVDHIVSKKSGPQSAHQLFAGQSMKSGRRNPRDLLRNGREKSIRRLRIVARDIGMDREKIGGRVSGDAEIAAAFQTEAWRRAMRSSFNSSADE